MTVLTSLEIRQARNAAQQSGRPIIEIMADSMKKDSYQALQDLALLFDYPVMDNSNMNLMDPAFDLLDYPTASQLAALLFREKNGQGLIALISDPFNEQVQRRLESIAGHAVAWYLAHPADIAAFLALHEESMRALDADFDNETSNQDAGSKVEELSILSISEDTSPVVKLVHSTLYDALKQGTSDIHLECTGSGLTIKYRIDGVLIPVSSVQGVHIAEQIISRIKVVSELDISETRTPQDGRMRVSMRGREIDLRVSIMPSIHGEDAVLRILDKKNLSEEGGGLNFTTLGFDDQSISVMRKMSKEPYGMLLVTGPTGSGKTTTLYAAISEINTGQDKIITIEDPVEYQLPGILQIPVNERKGLTFARGLRSILRHDPDKIMVGEIRDPETAQIAIQSALTGHLVLTTVHANNVLDVIGRFMHMGIDLYSFVSAVNCIMAQRLVRIICPHCKQAHRPDDETLTASGLDPLNVSDFSFFVGRGCGHCRGTGFKGRKAVSEIMILTDEIREMIIARSPSRQIRDLARNNGTVFLREAALALVRTGQTTLGEINRVTFVS
ncbi:GspE/PulE family protein [Limnohabitans sp. Jir72]|uniref:GspE/PulE family protein n=1 Tax=Limnohabitans sp. Jir72 TaxID=1977909 RepID=UPI000D39C70E|nr:GspE/PulE family protein [Limnohabitans sp. Jir72]PUE31362.1 general secretion pathway protein GspE [Limnohabitans sp. Jir72]